MMIVRPTANANSKEVAIEFFWFVILENDRIMVKMMINSKGNRNSDIFMLPFCDVNWPQRDAGTVGKRGVSSVMTLAVEGVLVLEC